ncbi:MAG: DUF2306 domain-containing protein [Pyrinomonadaceae bacterium]
MIEPDSKTAVTRSSLLVLVMGLLITIGVAAALARAWAVVYGDEAARFLVSTLPEGMRDEAKDFNMWFAGNPVLTLMHIVPGALFLLAAPVQFIGPVRTRYAKLHRWSGHILILTAILVAISGLRMATVFPFGGWAPALAAITAGTVFLFALAKAYTAIRTGDYVRHREWMIRMFAIGIGIAVVRVIGLTIYTATGSGFADMAGWAFWTGWLTSIAAAELWIRQTRLRTSRV